MSLGLIFAFMALSIGSLFFLYALKYYITIVLVLGFSRRAARNGKNGNGNGSRSGLGGNGRNGSNGRGIFYRLFGKSLNGNGANGNGNNHGLGMIPDYEKIPLQKQPFVSIHLPFYNEKKVANRILAACTSMDYENFQVVVVDDSTDETIDILEKWKTHPKVKVVHRTSREGWKGGALKVALEHSDPRTEFVIIFDADFVPYPDTIWQFLKYFNIGVNGTNGNGNNGNPSTTLGVNNLENGNYKKSNIAAVQGYQWHVLNKNENWITRGVRTEFAGSYVVERPGTEVFGSMKLIAGSVYMIRADILRKYGWGTSITEDFQLTLRLYADGYKVIYTPYVQSPSECVSTIKRLIRQRMRWAEGHTHNIKKMFWQILRSPHLQKREKLEFLYLSPYYLQAAFFLTGTLCWFISDAIFKTPLPFWTALWGWCLVLTNMFALPLMNGVGLFLEESPQKDYLGIFSFLLLCYILVPFQAYAAVKGLFEKEEGHWFRTPKTGLITDTFLRSSFRRFFETLFPGRRGVAHQSFGPELAYATANNQFDGFGVRKRNLPWLPKTVLIILLIIAVNLVIFARNVPEALASIVNNFYLADSVIDEDAADVSLLFNAGKWQKQGAVVGGTDTTFAPVPPFTQWWYSRAYPTDTGDASLTAGTHYFNFCVATNRTGAASGFVYTVEVGYCNGGCNEAADYNVIATSPTITYLKNKPLGCYQETIGSGSAYTFTASNKARIYTKMYVTTVNSVSMGYNGSTGNYISNLQTPNLTVPEKVLILLAIIPFLPFLVRKLQERKVRIKK